MTAVRLAVPALLLALALPARGDTSAHPQLVNVINQLAAIDPPPSSAALVPPVERGVQPNLRSIAADPSFDMGLRIRAVRSMAEPCRAPCATVDPQIHDDLLALIQAYRTNPSPTPRDLMLMRAAVESLGVAAAVADADIPTLLALLDHPSRDVRATVVRTLATTCSQDALTKVIALKRDEPTAQVRGELNLAEQAITSCVDH